MQEYTKTMTFDHLYHTLKTAQCPEDLFGDIATLKHSELKRLFRDMAQLVHPDHQPNNRSVANDAFKLLQYWYKTAVSKKTAYPDQRLITSPLATYRTTALFQYGDLADLYRATDGKHDVLLKICRLPKNNDLMQAEASALRRIERALSNDPLRAHFPRLRDSFRMRDGAGKERFVNVLDYEKETVTTADVLSAYPNGIDAADAAWMFNRILAALGTVHSLGLIHGAVLPCHVLLRLSDHNGMLVDWCYAVETGAPLRAISPPFRVYYPPEVFAKRPSSPATDIYMAAMMLLRLLGGDAPTKKIPTAVPKPIAALLRGCLLESPHRRPVDAWALFDEFHVVLSRLYGRPRFRPFSL